MSPLPAMSTPAPRSKEIKSVCVFCGSGPGADPIYVKEAEELGKALAQNNYNLIYGGGSVGVMGAVAKALIDNGGTGKAIVPEPLYKHGSKQILEAIVVPDMHTRKRTMGDLCDAFIVLPGGYGTMEEMLEMITWSQLNIHSKPILLLNTKGYFDLFTQWIDHAVKENFVKSENTRIFKSCDSVEQLLESLKTYEAPMSRFGLSWTTSVDGESGRELI